MTALPRLAPFLGLLLAAPLRAAEDRVEPFFPAGEWDLAGIRLHGGPFGDTEVPKVRIRFSRDRLTVFENDGAKPKEVAPLKIIRLAGAGDGILLSEDNAAKKQYLLYRFRGGRLELCTGLLGQDKLPKAFGGDGTVVLVLVPSSQGRILSANSPPRKPARPVEKQAPPVQRIRIE